MNPIRDREECDVDSWARYRKSLQREPVTFWPLGFWIAVMLLLIYSLPAMADDVTLTWTNPDRQVTEVDAGPLTDLSGTRIWELVGEVDETQTEFVIEARPPGTYTYVATAVTESGDESRISGAATKVVESFKALAGSQVYQPVTINAGFWMIPAGTLTADTECDPTQRANDYYRVPLDNVEWLPGSDARPVMVVAECG